MHLKMELMSFVHFLTMEFECSLMERLWLTIGPIMPRDTITAVDLYKKDGDVFELKCMNGGEELDYNLLGDHPANHHIVILPQII